MQEIRAQIAVLDVKLDAIQTLLTERLGHLDDKVDANRAHSDAQYAAHDRALQDLTKRVSNLETNGAEHGGKAEIIRSILTAIGGAILALAVAWASAKFGWSH